MSAAKHVDPYTGRAIRQPYRESRDFANATLRFVRALGRRAGENPDDGTLLALASVAHEADIQMHRAVADLRDQGYSWAAIGDLLDMTRQSAQERFGRPARTRATTAPTTVTAAAPHPSDSPKMGISR